MACAVRNCKSTLGCTSRKESISFHTFPADDIYLKRWIEAVSRGDDFTPQEDTIVCSKHFTDDCYINTSQVQVPIKFRILAYDAVPTLLLPGQVDPLNIFSKTDFERQVSAQVKPTDPGCCAKTRIILLQRQRQYNKLLKKYEKRLLKIAELKKEIGIFVKRTTKLKTVKSKLIVSIRKLGNKNEDIIKQVSGKDGFTDIKYVFKNVCT